MRTLFTRYLAIFVTCVCTFAALPTLDAKDFIILRSGEMFVGQVLRVSDREVSIQLESGAFLSFGIQRVQKVQRYRLGKDFPEVIDFDAPIDDASVDENQDDSARLEPPQPISTPTLTFETSESDDEIEEFSPALIGSALSSSPSNEFAAVGSDESTRDWSFRVPSGFEPWHPDHGTEIAGAWMDPVTQAMITMSVYSQIGSGEDYRALTLGSLQRSLQPRIFRDQPIKDKDNAEDANGWLLDTEQTIAGHATRQLHLFVNRDNRTYILRCSSPAESFRKYVDHFEECVRSFQVHSSNEHETPTGDD